MAIEETLLKTNWIIAIGAIISSVGVFVGIVMTVIKYFQLKSKQLENTEKLDALKDIAISQNSMLGKMNQEIAELQNQTSEMKHSNFIMNDIASRFEDLIDNQIKAIESRDEYQKKQLERDINKEKSKIRPYFDKTRGGASQANESKIALKNFGEKAIINRIEKVELKGKIRNLPKENSTVKKDETIEFTIIFNEVKSTEDRVFEIGLFYTDKDGNKYSQILKGIYSNYHVGEPVEIK